MQLTSKIYIYIFSDTKNSECTHILQICKKKKQENMSLSSMEVKDVEHLETVFINTKYLK